MYKRSSSYWYSNSWWFHCPTFIFMQNIQMKTNQKNFRSELYCMWNEFKGSRWNRDRIYILFRTHSDPQNILYTSPFYMWQNLFHQIQYNSIISFIGLNNSGIQLEFSVKRSCRSYTERWELNNKLLTDKWIIEELKKVTLKRPE